MVKKSKIYIKPSKRGSLRKAMSAKKGKKLSVAEMQRKKKNASPAMKKKLQFAINARKWKHPDGGVVSDKPKNSKFEVFNNIKTPQTRLSIYPLLAQAGLVGAGADSLTLDQWRGLKPEDTLQYLDSNKGFEYSRGNTANPGGIKYWSTDLVPNTYSYVPSSKHYREQKGIKYISGGQVATGLGGIISAIPIPGASLIGSLFNFGGMLLGNQEKNRAEEKIALNEYQTGAQNAARVANVGLNNPYTSTFAYGGLTPYGTNIEVEDGEVMRGKDGSMVEFNGPTHAQGGIDVTAEPGAEIWGNLKISSGKYKGLEYKEAARRIKDKMTRLQNILNK